MAIGGGGWTVDRYVRFLQATLSIVDHTAVKVAVGVEGMGLDGLPERSAPERLRNDLRVLSATAGVVPREFAPDIGDPNAALGAAYVLRGSLLGGAVIAKTLGEQFGSGFTATSYLRPTNFSVPLAWKALTRLLSARDMNSGEDDHTSCVETARAMFLALESALRSQRVI